MHNILFTKSDNTSCISMVSWWAMSSDLTNLFVKISLLNPVLFVMLEQHRIVATLNLIDNVYLT